MGEQADGSVKDAVNTVWWFSKSDNPKKFYKPTEGPSRHDIAEAFWRPGNSGVIPSKLLRIANTDSNSHYLRTWNMLGRESHPARFPPDLPRCFIELLTDPEDPPLSRNWSSR